MLFNSLTFLAFFIVAYGLFWIIPTWSGKKWLLLIASYLFYAAWSPPYIILLLGSTLLDWWLARIVARSEKPSRRQTLLLLSLIGNLGLLGYFKYGHFLLVNFAALLSTFGITYHPPESNIILPIGISFYTFASLSYTIDVYRREIKADWRFADYALFVSFFPHLVAGPIVRASRLLPQIVAPRLPTSNQVGWGLAWVAMGLFSKVVMADALFAPVVDAVYAAPAKFGAVDTWAAVLSFSGQIYYDFSGYSLCAIGLAMCFGFSFPDNFQRPYGASSFSDFWRRWHITLSSWLRDYLYISMGGNRSGKVRTYGHLLATMLIGGLWHGASWMFVLWGGLHGVYLAVERIFGARAKKLLSPPPRPHLLRVLSVFLIVTLTWIPFRVGTTGEAVTVLTNLARTSVPPMLGFQSLIAMPFMLLVLMWQFRLRDTRLEEVFAKIGPIAQTGVVSSCLIGVFLFSGGDPRAFIYFQF